MYIRTYVEEIYTDDLLYTTITYISDVCPFRNCTHTMYTAAGVGSCPTKTYYTLTHDKINSHQLYLSLRLSINPIH